MTSGLPRSQSSAESRPGRVQRRHVRLHCRCEQSERDGQQAAGGVEHVSVDAARTLLGVKRSAFASPLVLRGAGARRRRRKVLSYQLCVGLGEEIAGRVTSAFTTNKEEPVLAGLELTLGAPLDERGQPRRRPAAPGATRLVFGQSAMACLAEIELAPVRADCCSRGERGCVAGPSTAWSHVCRLVIAAVIRFQLRIRSDAAGRAGAV